MLDETPREDLTHDPDQLVRDLDAGSLRFAHTSAPAVRLARLLGMPGLAINTWVDQGPTGGYVHVVTAVPVAPGEHIRNVNATALGAWVDEGDFPDALGLLRTVLHALNVEVRPAHEVLPEAPDAGEWFVVTGATREGPPTGILRREAERLRELIGDVDAERAAREAG